MSAMLFARTKVPTFRSLFTQITPPASSSPSSSNTLSIGIRREGKNRWERRVPLVPDQVERLVKELGVTVYIQPSTKRVIPNEKYVQAGAIVTEDLSAADIIMGVKEVPPKDLIPEKTYMFFSHTHKGQPYNMIMLRNILQKVRFSSRCDRCQSLFSNYLFSFDSPFSCRKSDCLITNS
jgi:hypothetical protein